MKLAINIDYKLVTGILLRFFYLAIGFVNIKLFLNSFSPYEYGMYSWIISAVLIATIIGFLGGQSEIFRRLTRNESISTIHISLMSGFMILTCVVFMFIASEMHQVGMFHLVSYVVLIILVKLICLYFRVIAKPIIIDFLNVGIVPVSLFMAFILHSNTFHSLMTFHLIVAYCILVLIVIASCIASYVNRIEFSSDRHLGQKSITNSLAFYSTSLSSIVFNTIDIFILGFFYSLEVVASYSFATRICAGVIYPLNFLIARYQPLIVGQKKVNRSEFIFTKFYAVGFMLFCMFLIMYFNDFLLVTFPDISSNLWVINVFVVMYILRVLFFEINCEVQFIQNIYGYSKVNVINLIIGIPLLFLIATTENLVLFCLVVFVIQMTPMFYSIIYKRFNSSRWQNLFEET